LSPFPKAHKQIKPSSPSLQTGGCRLSGAQGQTLAVTAPLHRRQLFRTTAAEAMADAPSPRLDEDETFGRDFNASPSRSAAPARSGLSLLPSQSLPLAALAFISRRALASA
jgi:hypothetical protein